MPLKLYEYSMLVNVNVVVAAMNEESARLELDETLSPEGVVNVGDIIDICDVDLFDIRDPKNGIIDIDDDAHLLTRDVSIMSLEYIDKCDSEKKKIEWALGLTGESGDYNYNNEDLRPTITTIIRNQEEADKRRLHGLHTNFLKISPMMGPIDLFKWLIRWRCCLCGYETISKNNSFECPECKQVSYGSGYFTPDIEWLIVCGGSEPIHPDWVRSLRDQCAEAEIPFCFQDWGDWKQCCPPEAWEGPKPDFEIMASHGLYFAKIGNNNPHQILDGKIYDERPEL